MCKLGHVTAWGQKFILSENGTSLYQQLFNLNAPS